MVYPDYFIPQLPAIRRSQEVQAANWGPWAGWTTHRAWGAVALRLGIAEVVMISYDQFIRCKDKHCILILNF